MLAVDTLQHLMTGLAAAMTMGPIVIMGAYLLFARKLGAFDAL